MLSHWILENHIFFTPNTLKNYAIFSIVPGNVCQNFSGHLKALVPNPYVTGGKMNGKVTEVLPDYIFPYEEVHLFECDVFECDLFECDVFECDGYYR